MKSTFTIIAILLCTLFVKAQITLTVADFGNIYYHAIQANDLLVDTANVHIGSPSSTVQTWDFTHLHDSTDDTLQFMSVAATAYSSSFGAANVAFKQSNGPLTTNFVNASATGLMIIGGGFDHGSFPGNTPNEADILTPPQIYMPFPSTYDSTFHGNTRTDIIIDTTFVVGIFTVDTVDDKHFITYTSTLDAFGSVTTPSGTFQCLRQKYMEFTIDSIYVHTTSLGWQYGQTAVVDSTLTYRWFANNQGFVLTEINMTHDSATHTWYPTSADYLKSNNTGINNISTINSTISVYPNPASSEINILNTGNNTDIISIYDMMGNKIAEQQMTDRITTISTSQYAAGLFFYRVTDSKNNPVSNGKFVKE